jgi:hypothetical protein
MPWLDCEEKSAMIAPAVCFEQACSATRLSLPKIPKALKSLAIYFGRP